MNNKEFSQVILKAIIIKNIAPKVITDYCSISPASLLKWINGTHSPISPAQENICNWINSL